MFAFIFVVFVVVVVGVVVLSVRYYFPKQAKLEGVLAMVIPYLVLPAADLLCPRCTPLSPVVPRCHLLAFVLGLWFRRWPIFCATVVPRGPPWPLSLAFPWPISCPRCPPLSSVVLSCPPLSPSPGLCPGPLFPFVPDFSVVPVVPRCGPLSTVPPWHLSLAFGTFRGRFSVPPLFRMVPRCLPVSPVGEAHALALCRDRTQENKNTVATRGCGTGQGLGSAVRDG